MVALAEAGLLLAPDSVELHGHAFMGLNKMAGELTPFDHCKTPDDLFRAVAYMRAALPHMEPYLRGTKLDVLPHLWCRSPWDRLWARLAMPSPYKRFVEDIDPVEHRVLCVELWKELMPIAERVLAVKASARVRDHSLYMLAPWSEPPQYLSSAGPGADRRFSNEHSFGTDGEVSSICKHRLNLMAKFVYLTDVQNLEGAVPHLLSPPWGRRDEPAYQEFLASVEKLPNEEMREAVRAVRAGVALRPRWMRGSLRVAPPPAKPPAKVVSNAEVVLHPVELTVVDTDGKDFRLTDRPGAGLISWIKTAEGVDAVLGRAGYVKNKIGNLIELPVDVVYLMKEKGRLIRLPLEMQRLRAGDPGRASGMNLCWDGRFLWVVSPGTREEASDATAAAKRFLAAIDPQTEQIVKLTADDGLPPMNHPVHGASAAVTAIGPGKVLVAGYFGRSWCGIATVSREKKIALDVFFEATNVYEPTKREESAAKMVAFPILFLCTLNPPAGAGQAAGQRVLLGRTGARPPLLIDPQKRSVEVLGKTMTRYGSTYAPYSVHDGGLYWWYASYSQSLYRIGFPDFREEEVNPSVPYSPFVDSFLEYDNRVYAWCNGQLYMSPDFRTPFGIVRRSAPNNPVIIPPTLFGLSHHYGMVLWGRLGLNRVEVRFH
jgi:hypothetical protein